MEVEGLVEMPGEAAPLTENTFEHVLKGAASNDTQRIKTCTRQLEEWQTRQGYYVFMQAAFLDKRMPMEVRYLAIIQLRNGIDKYWRRASRNEISKDDKASIRSRLVENGILESSPRLALHNALVVAKIARFDFPSEWPNLLNDLTRAIAELTGPGERPSHQLLHAMLILDHVVKELSLVRIGAARNTLKSMAPELVRILGPVYFDSLQPDWIRTVLPTAGQNAGVETSYDVLKIKLEYAWASAKIIRRLIVSLIDRPRDDEAVRSFWDNSLVIFKATLQIAISPDYNLGSINKDGSSENAIERLIMKNLTQLTKLHVNMAKSHPTDFALLQSSGNFEVIRVHWQLLTLLGQHYASQAGYPAVGAQVTSSVHDFDESQRSLIDQLGHQSLLLLRACIKMIFTPGRGLRYRTPEEKEIDNTTMANLKAQIFTESAVLDLINHAVTELFLFQPKDLQEWEEEPDAWEKREELESEDFDFAVRPCAEKLVLDLAINYKDLTTGRLLEMLSMVTSPGYSAVLQKDAVYSAIGIAASMIHTQLDFDSLLVSNLVPEVQVQDAQYKVLRRRIAILLGNWVTIRVSKEHRPLVYQIFQHLLNQEDPLNDQVVRVTAGRQLKHVVDAWEFEAQQFFPFAADILSRVMALVEEVELSETKMALLNTISIIVERMEHQITPYAERIVSILPPLWDQSGEEHLMKQAILALLSRLLISMKSTGAQFHALTLPIIRDTVIPGSSLALFLLEDTLDLWCTVVKETPTPSSPSDLNPDLLSLIQYLVPLLEQDSYALEKAIEITEGYITLAPSTMLSQSVFPAILTAFNPKLGTLRPEHNGYITNVVELAVRTAEVLGGVPAVRDLVSQMLSTKFFDGLIRGLKEAWEAHQTTGPKAIVTKIQGIVESDYLALLSRITYASPELLIDALQASEAAASVPEKMQNSENLTGVPATMHWLLEEWLSHAEDVGEPTRRKLMAMALTRLLELHQPFIVTRMQSLMSLWTNTIVELTDGNDDKTVDSLVYAHFGGMAPPIEELQSADAERRSALEKIDPVHTVNLIELVRVRLGECIARCGGEDRFREEVLGNIDREVVAGFGALGVM